MRRRRLRWNNGRTGLPYRESSAADTPLWLHTVTDPVTGPASARSRVAVSMGSVPAVASKLRLPCPVSRLHKERGDASVLPGLGLRATGSKSQYLPPLRMPLNLAD